MRPDGSNAGLLGEIIPPVAGGIINKDAPTAALHPLMDVHPGDIVVGKPRFGSFYGTDLELILRSRGIDTLIRLTGAPLAGRAGANGSVRCSFTPSM